MDLNHRSAVARNYSSRVKQTDQLVLDASIVYLSSEHGNKSRAARVGRHLSNYLIVEVQVASSALSWLAGHQVRLLEHGRFSIFTGVRACTFSAVSINRRLAGPFRTYAAARPATLKTRKAVSCRVRPSCCSTPAMSRSNCTFGKSHHSRCKRFVLSNRRSEMYGTVASGRCMHSASSCCISIGELELILTTLEAGSVYFLEKVKKLLIGWPMHVYPLFGFTTTRAALLSLWEDGPTKARVRAALFLHSPRSLPQYYTEYFYLRSLNT